MIKALIWDMDGVIIDSEKHYLRLEKEFLSRLGIYVEDNILEDYMGTPFAHYFPILAKKYGSTKNIDEAQEEYIKFIEELYQKHVELNPGVESVFKDLSKNYKFALATSTVKKLASQALDRFDLINFFSVRVHGDEIKNGKPDPEIFLTALNDLNLKQDEAVVIEDSLNGMKAGKAAGMKVIGYKAAHNKNIDFSLADFVVDDLREIPKIVESLRDHEMAKQSQKVNYSSSSLGTYIGTEIASGGDSEVHRTSSPRNDVDQVRENRIVGIIGGGQLGAMMTEAALDLDLDIIVLDPGENPPAVIVGAEQIKGDLKDPIKIKELAQNSDYLTWEIEHINTEVLEELEAEGYKINPSPKTLVKIKDKLLQKEFLRECGIPTAPFLKVSNKSEVLEAAKTLGLPLLLKTRFGGYDGRGNHVIKSEKDITEAFEKLGKENLYVEGFVDFERELSVIAVRDLHGEIRTYPVVETIHENNILQITLAPAPIPNPQADMAIEFAQNVMAHLDGAGVFGIEMFLSKDGRVLVNEIAPRVHNSGHFTIESCITSQFENHLRAVSGLELGDTSMKVGAAVMVNILGDREGVAEPRGIEDAEKLGDVFVHIYGKKQVKRERKMGHITITGNSLEEVSRKANLARSLIRI